MDSSPMTQGAANSFLPKKASRTDMERDVEVGARMLRVVEVVKALAVDDDEPRVEAKRSREWLWRGIIIVIMLFFYRGSIDKSRVFMSNEGRWKSGGFRCHRVPAHEKGDRACDVLVLNLFGLRATYSRCHLNLPSTQSVSKAIQTCHATRIVSIRGQGVCRM